jgi:uncharacterized repeat protein (TIGR04138 family)
MSMHHPKIDEVVRKDPRYPSEAYEFVYAALAHTQKRLNRLPIRKSAPETEHHVTGRELVEGIRDLALNEFGLMARTVFRFWGINKTDDFGELVFNLIEAGLMSRNNDDQRQDFHDIYDLDKALIQDYRIELTDDGEGSP